MFQAMEEIEEYPDACSVSNKSSSSFRPDIDLEWEGVELRRPVDLSDDDDDFHPKPSIALPEDDLSFSVPDDLWVLCDAYTHRTRPVMLPKAQLNNNATETIV